MRWVVTSWILCTAALLTALVVSAKGPQMFGITFAAEKTAELPVASAPPVTEIKVTINEFAFAPATITVPAGASVRWLNKDEIPHTVVGQDKSFKSKVLDSNEEFAFTFTKAGTYTYFCSIHPQMKGKVVVE